MLNCMAQSETPASNAASPPVTRPANQAPAWKPPGIGTDGSDWVQLKSGEWLRGQFKYLQNKDMDFESDELDELTLKLKDIKRFYSAHQVYTQFEGREPVLGKVVIDGDFVMVNAQQPLKLPRDDLIGITPTGQIIGLRTWSGDISIGASWQSGNTSQRSITTSAELARRTPDTTLLMDYLGNYSQVNDVQNENNDRLNISYDIRLNRDWFVRPFQAEYYKDPLANIAYRITPAVGAGYYIFDRDDFEWTLAAGPGYQYLVFENVEPGQSDNTRAMLFMLQSSLKLDITNRITFIQKWQSIFTSELAGRYTQHTVTTLEFEIKHHLNLDVSYIWDYIQHPQPDSNGAIPFKSDQYLTVGLGVRF